VAEEIAEQLASVNEQLAELDLQAERDVQLQEQQQQQQHQRDEKKSAGRRGSRKAHSRLCNAMPAVMQKKRENTPPPPKKLMERESE
jgi:hypothetical protein